ncbi:hypothetical protein [Pseudomonas aeruginosa]|uniref:hypothetical protein n=1 Tax=Pseudomonas aeruginosa TaxID=287 RepID=UPI001F16E884|nr:hypothetical protein [Pseudomonas aeruginosa]
MTKANECTCPSGDGSLRHPCPVHPASVEQAGGDECAALEAWWQSAEVLKCKRDVAMEAWQARAALAQPSQAQAEQAEQAEAERPEVVAWRYGFSGGIVSDKACLDEWKSGGEYQSLMTVAQHERIVGVLRAKIAQLRQHKNDYMDSGQQTYRALQNEIREREAEIARLDGLVSGRTAERDAALARVAELTATRNRYGLDAHYFNKNLQRILRDFESFTPDELARSLIILAKVADEKVVAQAQHSVPEGWRIERSAERIVVMNLKNGAGYAAARDGESGIAESVLYLLAADLLAAAPGKEGV